jgi:hypothetical protein
MTHPVIVPESLPAVPNRAALVPAGTQPFPPIGAAQEVHFHVHHHYAPPTGAEDQPRLRFPWVMGDNDDEPAPEPPLVRPTGSRWDSRAENGSAILLVLLVIAVLTGATLACTVYAHVVIPAIETAVTVAAGALATLVWFRRRW